MFGCVASLLLHLAFSSCLEWGYSLVAVRRLLVVVALSHCVAWVLACAGSVVVAAGLSCPKECGIFLD